MEPRSWFNFVPECSINGLALERTPQIWFLNAALGENDIKPCICSVCSELALIQFVFSAT